MNKELINGYYESHFALRNTLINMVETTINDTSDKEDISLLQRLKKDFEQTDISLEKLNESFKQLKDVIFRLRRDERINTILKR